MALVGTNWHVVIYDNTKKTGNVVFSRQCFRVQEANALIAEKVIEYPKPQYTVVKEKF